MVNRRHFLSLGSAMLMAGCATKYKGPRVIVVGGGYGGCTVAKYIRQYSEEGLQVTLIEPNPLMGITPMSNFVLNGAHPFSDGSASYEILINKYGVEVIHDRVTDIQHGTKQVVLSDGSKLSYDKLVVSPGVEFLWSSIPGMDHPQAHEKVLHAWRGVEELELLRAQLQTIPNGGVYALTIPLGPFPGMAAPYERASLIAEYFKHAKPRSRVVVLDENQDILVHANLFKAAWADKYKGILEYFPRQVIHEVDSVTRTLRLQSNGHFKANVLNMLPACSAGKIALQTGLAADGRWCDVNPFTYESLHMKDVYVIGDAVKSWGSLSKSATIANQQGKVCAGAVVQSLLGKSTEPALTYIDTSYTFVSLNEASFTSNVHRYSASSQALLAVPGSGGVGSEFNRDNGRIALDGINALIYDTLG